MTCAWCGYVIQTHSTGHGMCYRCFMLDPVELDLQTAFHLAMARRDVMFMEEQR